MRLASLRAILFDGFHHRRFPSMNVAKPCDGGDFSRLSGQRQHGSGEIFEFFQTPSGGGARLVVVVIHSDPVPEIAVRKPAPREAPTPAREDPHQAFHRSDQALHRSGDQRLHRSD